jgi:hypothetical protein
MCEPAGATATPDARGPRDGCRASAARSPGEGWSVHFQRCPAPARAKRRTRWRRLPENCVTASKEAVETPGGGRDRLSSSDAPRHRRVASRSGGATSAERDGRPVYRRNRPRGAAAERGSPKRAWRMPGAAKKVMRRVEPMSTRRSPGTAPVGPDRNASPLRPFSRSAGPKNHVPP